MAYKNLVNQSCTDKAEYFCRMRDFICKRNGTYDYSTTGIGWTLHDSSYATDEDNPAINDWIVVYSAGESGDEDLYFYIKYVNGTIDIKGYLYWNNTTHAGVQIYNNTANIGAAESGAYTLYVYGDLDFLTVIETENAAYNQACPFGKLKNDAGDDTVATSAGSLSSGTDISITVDAVPSSWEVGRNVYIRDNSHTQLIEIKSLVGLVITADLTYSFTAGCKLQSSLNYWCNSSTTTFAGVSLVNRTTGTATIAATLTNVPVAALADPDEGNSEWVVFPLHCLSATGYYGSPPEIYYIGNGGLTDQMVFEDPDTGYQYRHILYYYGTYLVYREV